jgi:hypothetical protein
MTYNLYKKLIENPPKLEIPVNTTEMMIHTVSVMCDNKQLISMKKYVDGWSMNTRGQAFTNFQTKCYQYEIEWAADANDWDKAFELLNSGTIVIEKIVCR